MRNTLKPILTLMTVGLGFFNAQAQEPMVLSLDSAVSYSLSHNKQLQNSKFAIDKSSLQIKEAIAAGLPQISAKLDYQNFLGAEAKLQLGPAVTTIEFNPTSNFQASVSQLIFSGNYIVGIQMAKLAKVLTEQSLEKDELNLKEQTTKAYYMILVSEEILGTIKRNKENLDKILDKMQNMANVGVIEQIEVKKLSVTITTIDNAIKSTERQIELGYNLLRLQLGLEPTQPIALASTLEQVLEGKTALDPNGKGFDISNNPDIKLLELQMQMAEKSINMKRANYLPTLAGFYSYTEKLKSPAFDMSPKNVIGLSLNIPIFSGGQRHFQVSQAKVDLHSVENSLQLVKDQLSIQEKQLTFNYINLLEQYQYQKQSIEVAKEVLENVTQKYEQGLVSSLELTNANTEYLQAESSYTGLLMELLNAELALRKLNNNL